MAETEDIERRGFLTGAIYAMWGLIAAALGAPAVAYLLVPPSAQEKSDWVEAGSLSQLDTGVPEEVVFRHNRVDGWKVTSEKTSAWVVKTGENRAVAFAPWCTHLGCAYHWEMSKQEFVCPCHSSVFSIDGKVVSGPAPRPLDRFPVRLEGDKLWIQPLDGGRQA